MTRLVRSALLLSLVLLLTPAPVHAQIPFLQYGIKRIFKEFGRGVRLRSFVLQEPNGGLARYDRLEVAPFENEILDLMPHRMDEELAEEVVRHLKKEKLFHEIVLRPPPLSPAAASTESLHDPAVSNEGPRTLLLTGTIKDYYPGSEALRALNMGLRSLYVIVQVRLQDKASGEELYREQIAVEVYKVGGKAYRTALKATAKEVAKRLNHQHQLHSKEQEVAHRLPQQSQELSNEKPQSEKKQTAHALE